MTNAGQTRFLHVANGTCTTRLIEAAGIPGARSIWADPLYEGPVPGGLTDAELLEVRTRHLPGQYGQVDVDAVNDSGNGEPRIERHESYDELILWFEHDLFDQLNLVQLLTWIRERAACGESSEPRLHRIVSRSSAIQGARRAHARRAGVAARQRGSRSARRSHALAERAWQAFREPTPEALDVLRHSATRRRCRISRRGHAIPPGISLDVRRTLSNRAPAAAAGADGASISPAAFPRMHEGEDAYYITDLSFADLAEALSRTSPPLLARVRRRIRPRIASAEA